MTDPKNERKQVSEVQSGKDPEAAFGGADAVPKTTYTSPQGTSMPERRGSARGVTASAPSGGVGKIGWIVGGLVLLALIAYAAGVFR